MPVVHTRAFGLLDIQTWQILTSDSLNGLAASARDGRWEGHDSRNRAFLFLVAFPSLRRMEWSVYPRYVGLRRHPSHVELETNRLASSTLALVLGPSLSDEVELCSSHVSKPTSHPSSPLKRKCSRRHGIPFSIKPPYCVSAPSLMVLYLPAIDAVDLHTTMIAIRGYCFIRCQPLMDGR